VKVNIENCVRHMRAHDDSFDGRLYMVEQLIGHLKELRDRAMAGDADAALTELFDCYVFDDGVKFAMPSAEEKGARAILEWIASDEALGVEVMDTSECGCSWDDSFVADIDEVYRRWCEARAVKGKGE
jgi:hypothetical protein